MFVGRHRGEEWACSPSPRENAALDNGSDGLGELVGQAEVNRTEEYHGGGAPSALADRPRAQGRVLALHQPAELSLGCRPRRQRLGRDSGFGLDAEPPRHGGHPLAKERHCHCHRHWPLWRQTKGRSAVSQRSRVHPGQP